MKHRCFGVLTGVGFALFLFCLSRALAQSVGATRGFAALAATTVTNTGSSVIRGDLGLSPGAADSITGFPPGLVYGMTHAADANALEAQSAANHLYSTIAAQPPIDGYLSGQVLGTGGTVPTLAPGIYTFSSSAQLTGTLLLNTNGNPGAVWMFRIGSTLTTASGASVIMSTGGSPCNVYWQVGNSATLGADTSFLGNIVALTSITLNNGASVTGRVLAQNGALTLDTNTIDATSCGAAVTLTPLPVPALVPTPVPTLPEWAIVALMALLALAGFSALRWRTM